MQLFANSCVLRKLAVVACNYSQNVHFRENKRRVFRADQKMDMLLQNDRGGIFPVGWEAQTAEVPQAAKPAGGAG